MLKNIGFVSTRFSGTDGVSLESSKWADIFENSGYQCFWFAGEVDREPEKTFLEAVYFKKPIMINRYATFVRDIEPLGFDLVVMDGFLSKKTIKSVLDILESSKRKKKWSPITIESLPATIPIQCCEIS